MQRSRGSMAAGRGDGMPGFQSHELYSGAGNRSLTLAALNRRVCFPGPRSDDMVDVMLLDIAKLPTAENSAIHLHPSDNVAIARVAIAPGTELLVDGVRLVTVDAIPAGHKVALRMIAPGERVERYGQAIGRARAAIEPGRHVHTHNLALEELQPAYEFPSGDIAPPVRKNAPCFLGYVREDGRVGTRNYIAVVAASNCAAHTAEMIAQSFHGER